MKSAVFTPSLAAAVLATAGTAWSADKPNIVLILADDLGWMDTGYAGSDFYETPHIDQLGGADLWSIHAPAWGLCRHQHETGTGGTNEIEAHPQYPLAFVRKPDGGGNTESQRLCNGLFRKMALGKFGPSRHNT